MYFIFQQHWVQGSNLIILSNFIISSNHKTSPSPCLYSSTTHSVWPSSHVFTSLVTSIPKVTSLNTSLLDSSLNPIFSNILILAMFSILILTSYLLIPNFSTPYLSNHDLSLRTSISTQEQVGVSNHRRDLATVMQTFLVEDNECALVPVLPPGLLHLLLLLQGKWLRPCQLLQLLRLHPFVVLIHVGLPVGD